MTLENLQRTARGPTSRPGAATATACATGHPPGAAHGVDVYDQGYGVAAEQQTYHLIRQPKPVADRQFEIEFLDPGVEAYAFTFG